MCLFFVFYEMRNLSLLKATNPYPVAVPAQLSIIDESASPRTIMDNSGVGTNLLLKKFSRIHFKTR